MDKPWNVEAGPQPPLPALIIVFGLASFLALTKIYRTKKKQAIR